jgi:phosphatidylglycerol---prolipoprotein diacylglyceryl transferase
MTFPVNLHLWGLEISAHQIFEILAYTIGFRYYLWLRKQSTDPISEMNRLWIFIGACMGAFFMAHLVGILEKPEFLQRLDLLYFMGNKTIVGGIVGGLIGVEITKKIIGESHSSGDLIAYPLMLGMAIGRIGCFLAGLEDGTYGIATNMPWGIDFGDNIRRHPTQLYDVIFLLSLWQILLGIEKKYVLQAGARFKLFMTAYLAYRFGVEFIKPIHFFSFGLGTIQIVCILTLIYYYKVWLFPRSLLANSQIKNSVSF